MALPRHPLRGYTGTEEFAEFLFDPCTDTCNHQGATLRGREDASPRFLCTQGSAADAIAEAGTFWLAVTALVAASPTVPAQAVAFMAGTQATTGDPVSIGIIAPAAATGLITDGAGTWATIIGTIKAIVVAWFPSRPAFVARAGLSKRLPQIGQLTNRGGGDCRKNTFDGSADHFAPVELAGK